MCIRDRNSIGKQITGIQEFAASNGYELGNVYSEYVSAYNEEKNPRFQWKQCLRELKKDKNKTLIVFTPSRLTRRMKTIVDIPEEILQRIRFCDHPDDPMDHFLLQLMIALSEKESRRLSTRIKKGIENAKSKAEKSGKEYVHGSGYISPENTMKGRSTIQKNKKTFLSNNKSSVRRDEYELFIKESGLETRCVRTLIGNFLNWKDIGTPRGGVWTYGSVNNLLRNIYPDGNIEFGAEFLFN